MRTQLAMVALGAVGLAGCAPSGALSPGVQSKVDVGFAELCVDTPARPSVLSAARAVPTNAQRAADVTSLAALCANGSPTNLLTAALDFSEVYSALQRDFPSLKLK